MIEEYLSFINNVTATVIYLYLHLIAPEVELLEEEVVSSYFLSYLIYCSYN